MGSRNAYYGVGEIRIGRHYYKLYRQQECSRKPTRHQGKKEVARRRSQIERGVLKTN